MAFIIEAGLCVATNMEVFVFSLYLYSILVLNLRTRKVLPAIDNPLHNRDYHNNRECNDTVIYPVSQSRGIHNTANVLMLLPVTGRPGGNKNNTVVRAIYDREI